MWSSSPSINNLHKTCTYLQQAGACFWGDDHTEKRSNTQWRESLQSQCDNVGARDVMSILDTCLHQDMQYKYFCNSHSTLWHSKCGWHSAWNQHRLHCPPVLCFKTHSTQLTIGTDTLKICMECVFVMADATIKYIYISQKDERL